MMSVPAPEIRLAILFASVFAIALFVGVIIIMHSLGNMANHLQRMEYLISKESILRFNRQINHFKQQKQREIARIERERRNEDLIAIPLVRNVEQRKKERL